MPLNTIPNKGLTSRGYPSDRLVTPIIINGDMSVAQRGTDFNDAAHQAYSVDRYRFHKVNTGELVMNIDQVTDVPTGQGFSNSLKLSVGTAESATASNELVSIGQRIEAQNLQNLRFGTSSADNLTLSFWVKSSLTGTYSVLFFQQDASSSPDRRYYSQPFTINAADTWEKKIINISGNQDDTISNDNGIGLDFRINLSAGSSLTSGSSDTWGSSTNTAVGQTANFSGTASATFFFTGVQLEVGEFDSTTLPSFPFESYASNFIKCQRYCQVYKTENAYGMMSPASVNSSTVANGIFTFPTYLRAIPSLSTSGSFGLYSGDGGDAVSGIVIDANSDDASRLVCTISGSGFTDNSAAFLRAENDSDAKMTFDAEL